MPASYDDYDEVFRDFTGSDNDIEAAQFIELYQESGAFQEDSEDDSEMFFQFLNAFYPDVESHPKAYWEEIRKRSTNCQVSQRKISTGSYGGKG